jgi:hypothetical protein
VGGGFGGVGGGFPTTFCNNTNCAGCCFNGQCINFPNNLSDFACGVNGITCTDCTAVSSTCDQSAGICRFNN